MASTVSSFLAELQRTSNQNVFIMMRYRSSPHFTKIEESIRNALRDYGLVARLAKDCAIVDDLWENIVLYIEHSRFGIAVFEDIDEREFNPNISLELGYMYALGKRCLLLKERRMPRLPTDICGRIYRDFDALDLSASIEKQIREWCMNDLRLMAADLSSDPSSRQYVIAFDNQSEDPEFRAWGVFSSDRLFSEHIKLHRLEGSGRPGLPISFMQLLTKGTESAGINKDLPFLQGRARFEYKAVHSSAENPNLLFCMIPMKGRLKDLIEVGAKRRGEAANAYSPYRVRYFVPESHIGDGSWHQAEIDFDFRTTPDAAYSIFAPRINEGCPRPGPGELHVRNIEILLSTTEYEELPAPSERATYRL